MSALARLSLKKPDDATDREREADECPLPGDSSGDGTGEADSDEPTREELLREMEKLQKRVRGLELAKPDVPGRAAAKAAMKSLAARGRARDSDHAPAGRGGGLLRSVLARPGRDTPRPPSPRRHRRGSSRGRRRRYGDEESSSDSGYESERRSRRRDDGASYRDGDRVAARILRRIDEMGFRTVSAYVRQQPISNERSRHEARRAAQAIDAFIKEGVSPDFLGMEILVRTVSGIIKADSDKNSRYLEQWEWQPPESILDRDMEQALYRNVDRVMRLEKKRAPPSTNPSSAANGGRARD
jgi:hypothetical protein